MRDFMAGVIESNTLRVQIQTQSGCNGRCVFCPNHAVVKSDLPQGRMTWELFCKVVNELATLSPRRISLYLMNEPLLDPRLPELIRYVADKCPSVTTLITSNGTALNEELGFALINSGLRRLKVSLQSLDAAVNKELMGGACDSEKVIRNVQAFKKQIAKERSSIDLRVSMFVTRKYVEEIAQARAFWRKNGIRLVTSSLENRGGNIADAADLNPHAMARLNGNCGRPSRDMCILWNGDVALCCVDWWRTTILGNVGAQSVAEVWTGPRANAIRIALRENDTGALPAICVNCAQSAAPDYHRSSLKGMLSRLLRKE
jgi:MoaA/NifB/PqqE/SkfB family radical SAM enzyme